MKRSFFILTTLLLMMVLGLQSVHSYPQFCLQYKSSQCIRCPTNTHVYQNQCYNNSIGCLDYVNGDECTKCNTTFTYLYNKKCIPLVEGTELDKYIVTNVNPGDQYGERAFILTTIVEAQKDTFFLICDNFMKKGEYGHFISKSAQPIVSVSWYDSSRVRQFKILYEGGGASLLLCLIGINMDTKKIQLRSFVTIGISKFVDLCIDYTTNSECIRCSDGYHLQNGVCYRNVPQCISYVKDVCVECRGYSLLVQNRCISDCEVLADTRTIRFYHNFLPGSIIPIIDHSYFAF